MGETLRQRLGPLPVWVWTVGFVVLLAVYLSYRKRQAATAAAAAAATQANNVSSNLGTVPVSNLTTAAQPMPIQLGDTFVDTTVPQSITTTATAPTSINNTPSYTMQTAQPPAPSPAVAVAPSPPRESAPVQTLPGYGAGLGSLLGLNPGLLSANTPGGQNIPGITGYQVSYNGVPL